MCIKGRKLAVVLALTMSLGLTACGNESANADKQEALPEAAADTVTDTETEAVVTTDNTAAETAGDEAVKAEDTTVTEAESAQDAEPVSDREANFDVAKEDYTAYGQKIMDAVAAKDLEALADLTAFPVYLGLDEGSVVETREDFLAFGPDKIFTPEMVDSIANADLDSLAPSMAGFTLSDSTVESAPSITFSIVNGSLAITGIN